MQTLKKDFNSIAVARGELFALELPSNPSTGYAWKVSVEAGKAALLSQTVVTPQVSPDTGMVIGGGATSRYVFMAESAGDIELSAVYKQPFSKAPATPVKFKITVS